MRYFNDFDIDSLSLYIKDQLYEKNFIKNSDFFVPVSNADNKYLINKIKILNHKWIIADFSNGSKVGRNVDRIYFKKNKIVFNVKDYFLY